MLCGCFLAFEWLIQGDVRENQINAGEKLRASNTAAVAGSPQTPRPGPLSHSLITPFYRNSEIVVSQFGRLMTYPQLQRWMPSASLHSTPLLGLFYFCCFGFARPLCVCCFAVVRPWTVSMALHGRASSLWDNLPCLFDHTYLRRLHLLKVFTRKASWVSVSPGAHLSVRKWKDYAFIFF